MCAGIPTHPVTAEIISEFLILTFSLSILASGSRGNALILNTGDTKILIDCGLGVRTLFPLLQSVGVYHKDLTAILITHEHTDHVRGLDRVLNHTHAALYATAGTLAAIDYKVPARTTVTALKHEPFEIGAVTVRAIPTPHDASEPVAYHFTLNHHRLTVATDLGEVTPDVAAALANSTVAVFESNHDEAMLKNGSYPELLKRRIRSNLGHLSNRQCAEALRACRDTELKTVILAHLSDENNDPAIARASAQTVLSGSGCDLHVTRQGATGPYLKFDSHSHTNGVTSCEPSSLFPLPS
jgi:phosphoribosyl 1,2-cyclic phosphodiesterase